jgi:tetratricopeptide (TPR) repeat protein
MAKPVADSLSLPKIGLARVLPFSIALLLSISLAGIAPLSAQNPRSTTAEWRASLPDLLQWTHDREWDKVLATTATLLKTYPQVPELLLFEAGALHGKENYSQAIQNLQDFLKKYPESPHKDQALYLLGDAHLKVGNRGVGVGFLREASRTTVDKTLVERIDRILSLPASAVAVGISLGGKPPENPEEIETARKVAHRILLRAVRAYRDKHGKDPLSLEDLVAGDPPVLRALPENPEKPRTPIQLEEVLKEGSSR